MCVYDVLDTYSGSAGLKARWEANNINIRWYSDGELLDVQDAADSCDYGGGLTVPSTPPTKIGYTFSGWTVRIPGEYTELQYIESTRTQYIDTGYALQETDSVEVDYYLTNLSATSDKFIIGQRSTGASSDPGMWVETYSNSNTWYVRYGSTSSVNKTFANSEQSGTFIVKKQSFSINGTEVLQPGYTSMPSGSLTIFGRLNSGNTFYGSYVRISSVRIKNGTTLLHNYVPVKRKSDNVLGMYDTVSKTFFTNAGSETFIEGPAVQ